VKPARFASWPPSLQGLAGVGIAAAVAELAPRTGLVPARFVPPLSEVLHALGAETAERDFWRSLANTLTAWSIGLGIALVAGVAAGLVIGSVPVLRRVTASTIEFLRPIPSVALVPLVALLYSTGIESTLVLVVYASFWQVLIQVLYGVTDVDPVLRETARSYCLGRVSRLRHLVWPSALPFVMTGVRLAASVALVLTITAELVIGSPGLGSAIAVAQSSGALPKMYALIIVTGVIGVVVNLAARAMERRSLHWHTSMRTEALA
jgi:ABC-type nitrate/sulfonate/bicarbonate transport system permease component